MVEKMCEKGELRLEWNSKCVMKGEGGEQVGGELESVTSSAGWFMQGWRDETGSWFHSREEVRRREMSDWWFLEK